MKNLTDREKTLLAVMVAVLVIFIYYRYYLNAEIKNISVIKANITKYKLELNNIEQAVKSNTKQKSDLQNLKEKYAAAEKALPSAERNPEISYDLKPLMDKNKVELNSVSFGDAFENSGKLQANKSNQSKVNVQLPGKLMAVPVNISLSGNYENIINFIEAVEKDKRIAEVDSVNIESTDGGKLQSSITMNCFYVMTENKDAIQYDFNKDKYGKTNLFK